MENSEDGHVIDVETNLDFLMPHVEVGRILAVDDGGVIDDHLEVLADCVHHESSSRSAMNERVDVDCYTSRTGFFLAHPDFAKLGQCSPAVSAACRRDCYRCGLNQCPLPCR